MQQGKAQQQPGRQRQSEPEVSKVFICNIMVISFKLIFIIFILIKNKISSDHLSCDNDNDNEKVKEHLNRGYKNTLGT